MDTRTDAHHKRERRVYFFRCEDGGPVKIGSTTRRITSRLREIQRQCTGKLCIVATIRASERLVHKHFRNARIDKEWFHGTPELLELIDTIRRGDTLPSWLAHIAY